MNQVSIEELQARDGGLAWALVGLAIGAASVYAYCRANPANSNCRAIFG
jgi:hypothetical protein